MNSGREQPSTAAESCEFTGVYVVYPLVLVDSVPELLVVPHWVPRCTPVVWLPVAGGSASPTKRQSRSASHVPFWTRVARSGLGRSLQGLAC